MLKGYTMELQTNCQNRRFMRTSYDFVFVVLAYRNTQDLRDFFQANHIERSKIVVVNSFYDEASEQEFRSIATDNGADFISVPNKGYGAGNNAGVTYAIEHYEFNYLVISNADIKIERMEMDVLGKYNPGIIAPKILTLHGRNQNPSCPFKPAALYEKFRYAMFKGGHTKLIWVAYAYSRLTKIVYQLVSRWKYTIFSAHGAFVILHSDVVRRLHPLYNERMFLFNEEEHLGRLAEKHGVKTWYEPNIIIRHKEDGSMKLASVNEFERARDSFLEYYKFWGV